MGKGRKERIIPFGEECAYWISRYASEVRSAFVRTKHIRFLFVECDNQAISYHAFLRRFKKLAQIAGLAPSVTPHMVRHSFATHLMNHGACIRQIQRMMGHSDIGSTAIYLRVARARLKRIHAEHHPRG